MVRTPIAGTLRPRKPVPPQRDFRREVTRYSLPMPTAVRERIRSPSLRAMVLRLLFQHHPTLCVMAEPAALPQPPPQAALHPIPIHGTTVKRMQQPEDWQRERTPLLPPMPTAEPVP